MNPDDLAQFVVECVAAEPPEAQKQFLRDFIWALENFYCIHCTTKIEDCECSPYD